VSFDPIAMLRAAHGGIAAETAVDARVDQLREELAAMGVNITPPVDPTEIARALGIEVRRVAAADVRYDGALFEAPDGRFAVLLNRCAGAPARERFTLAHEIVHTLVPADPSRPRFRTPERRKRPDAAVERLIDRGAARLLMPPDIFRADLEAAGIAPAALIELASRYAVSREAAAVQAMIHWPQPAAVVFCELVQRPSSDGVPLLRELPRWRVQKGFASAGFPVYPYVGMAFADGGAVERAAVTGREVVAQEEIGGVHVRVMARALSRRVVPPPRVMGVVEAIR
jgi:Zn-dependent peptidase ImmA (M78 family)